MANNTNTLSIKHCATMKANEDHLPIGYLRIEIADGIVLSLAHAKLC